MLPGVSDGDRHLEVRRTGDGLEAEVPDDALPADSTSIDGDQTLAVQMVGSAERPRFPIVDAPGGSMEARVDGVGG
jgi:hypothetical protein